MHLRAAPFTLKQLDGFYHCAQCFITGDKYRTHHCVLYETFAWSSPAAKRELPVYMLSFLFMIVSYCSCLSVSHHFQISGLVHSWYPMNTEFGQIAFQNFEPYIYTLLNKVSFTIIYFMIIKTLVCLLEGNFALFVADFICSAWDRRQSSYVRGSEYLFVHGTTNGLTNQITNNAILVS